jgi:hypothetical protein
MRIFEKDVVCRHLSPFSLRRFVALTRVVPLSTTSLTTSSWCHPSSCPYLFLSILTTAYCSYSCHLLVHTHDLVKPSLFLRVRTLECNRVYVTGSIRLFR